MKTPTIPVITQRSTADICGLAFPFLFFPVGDSNASTAIASKAIQIADTKLIKGPNTRATWDFGTLELPEFPKAVSVNPMKATATPVHWDIDMAVCITKSRTVS